VILPQLHFTTYGLPNTTNNTELTSQKIFIFLEEQNANFHVYRLHKIDQIVCAPQRKRLVECSFSSVCLSACFTLLIMAWRPTTIHEPSAPSVGGTYMYGTCWSYELSSLCANGTLLVKNMMQGLFQTESKLVDGCLCIIWFFVMWQISVRNS